MKMTSRTTGERTVIPKPMPDSTRASRKVDELMTWRPLLGLEAGWVLSRSWMVVTVVAADILRGQIQAASA